MGRREDGLHELVTIMLNVDLADSVTLSPGEGLLVSGPYAAAAPPDPQLELASRALRALERKAGRPLGQAVAVEKNIPVAAGLGGGSADAAAVLRAAAALGVDARMPDLEALALELGADVPFQLHGGTAVVRGVGERVEGLPKVDLWLALAHAGLAVSTASVFAALRKDEWSDGAAVAAAAGDPARLRAPLPNALLAPARRMFPELGDIEAALRGQGWSPRMTGSGSTFFQVGEDRADAERLAAGASALGFAAWAVHSTAP